MASQRGDRTRVSDARTLASVTPRLEACRAIPDAVQLAANAAAELLDAPVAAVMVLHQETSTLLTGAPSLAAAEKVLGGELHAEDHPVLRIVVRDRLPVIVDVTAGYAPGSPQLAEATWLRSIGLSSVIVAPIMVNSRVWGELWVGRLLGEPALDATAHDLTMVLASLTGGAIARIDVDSQVRHLIADDTLTGLANRRVADRVAEDSLASGQQTCVVMADVDGLKRVNDELGHDMGDDLLRAAADVMRRAADRLPGALAARMGGDEFCIVTTGQERLDVVEAMQAETSAHTLPYGAALSWGVAAAYDGESLRGLFRRADAAQYQAKRARAAAIQAQRRRADEKVVTAEKVLLAGVEAISSAPADAVMGRLAAVASAITEALGGTSWNVLRTVTTGDIAVARGGSPGDRRVAISLRMHRHNWGIEVDSTVGEIAGTPLEGVIRTLLDVAVLGARPTAVPETGTIPVVRQETPTD